MTRSSLRATLLVLGAVAACRSGGPAPTGAAPAGPTWPELPTSVKPAQQLLDRRSREAPRWAPVPATAEALLALLVERQRQGRLVAGWPAIVTELQRRLAAKPAAYLLVGTHHDTGGQIEAFRRLVGPIGLEGLTAASVEQLPADGHWSGVPAPEQAGASADVARYLSRGDRVAFNRILAQQHGHDHTAWKYRYLPSVMDLVVTARATNLRLLGCDMSPALQRRLRSLEPGLVDRLRELHCLLALERGLAGVPRPHRVAMLWGQAHLAPGALPRLLPTEAGVVAVYLFGHRPGPAGPEVALADRLALTDPVLLSVDDAQLVLLLDGPRLGARLHQARDWLEGPLPTEAQHRVEVRSTVSGTLRLGKHTLEVTGAAPAQVTLPAGGAIPYLYSGTGGRLMIAGALELPAGGAAELDLQTDRREVLVTLRLPGNKP